MDKRAQIKSFDTTASSEDMVKINKFALVELKPEDVFIFPVKLCDNNVDRDNDKFTHNFLQQVADKSVGLTGLLDHQWISENQKSRIFDAQLVKSDTEKNNIGEPLEYVLAKAYTTVDNTEYINKIKSGLFKEVSIGFESDAGTCSICGGTMHYCECDNGHIKGQTYEDKKCYNIIDNLTEMLEWSIVSVPAQRDAGIKEKMAGPKNKHSKEYLLSFNKKDENELSNGEQPLINKKRSKEEQDMDQENIKALTEENARLKAKVKELEDSIKQKEEEEILEKKRKAVEDTVDSWNPLTPVVKENIMNEVDYDALKIAEDGSVEGLEILEDLHEKYAGLFKEETEEVEDKLEEIIEETKGAKFTPKANMKTKQKQNTRKSGFYF